MKRMLFFILLFWLSSAVRAEQPVRPMRLALSAVFLGEQQEMVLRWRKYLEEHMHRPVEFVQRRTYRELVDMMSQGTLDGGWVCGAPYVRFKSVQRLLAVPVWKGKPLYRSYLIVPARDTTTRSIADLRNRIFAYSDPESNSGHYVVLGDIVNLGGNPDTFFKKTIYTYAHRKSVEAVANGLVDGARVDGYIYDQLNRFNPELIAKTRLVDKSAEFGFPPMVTRANLPETEFIALRDTLLNMQNNTEGRALLNAMGLDSFTAGDDQLFDGVAKLIRKVQSARAKYAE